MGLIELLKRPESTALDCKRDLSAPDGALKTIVARANTAGGTLLFGVEDRSRQVRGVDSTEGLLGLTRSGGLRTYAAPRPRRVREPRERLAVRVI